MADDDRSRLHEVVEQLPEQELALALRLLELLSAGSLTGHDGGAAAPNGNGGEHDSGTSPETRDRLSQLTDDELLHLDGLLATDREAAKQFWRDRFGEELTDDQLTDDDG